MKRTPRLLRSAQPNMLAPDIWGAGGRAMAEVHQSVELKANADQVWSLVGRFDGLAQWHPAFDSSQTQEVGGKSQRILMIAGGGKVTEQLEALDDQNMSYSYIILDAPLPVEDYFSTISVRPLAEGCIVDWRGKFNAKGVTEEQAIQVIESVYITGLDALKKQFDS